MLLQMAFVKFLYTNVWCNVGGTNDEFWSHFLRRANILQFLLLCAASYMGSFCNNIKQAICLGVPPECRRFPTWPLPA